MIKHVIIWRLKDEAGGKTKVENAAEMKRQLEGLVGKIDGLLKLEVGFNFNGKGPDLCLYSEFPDKAALAFYDKHPLHEEVRKFVHSVVEERVGADYEMD